MSDARTPDNCRNNNGSGAVYAAVNTYSPHGAIQSLSFGNGVLETAVYNNRLQPSSLSLGTAGQPSSLWQLQYEYVRGALLNNGNVLKQTLTVPGMAVVPTEYKYDSANRLEVAVESPIVAANPTCSSGSVAANGWCHKYDYGAWGNRKIGYRLNDGPGLAEPVNFSAATNRISDAGWEYAANGARGEISKDPTGRRYVYDGEGKMVLSCPAGATACQGQWQSGWVQYTYDADGQRVRIDNGNGSATVYAYDAGGQLAAEYGTAPGEAGGRQYLTADHLGSTRVVTGDGGVIKERHDYQPFGGKRSVSGGSPRFGVTGYGVSEPDPGTLVRFTGKERDGETGLDYFGARYYSGAQGRFTSPDRVIVTPARMEDPQQFNLYSYARNNPFKFIDPNGEDIDFANDTEEGRKKALVLITKNLSAAEAANIDIRQTKSGAYEAYVVDKNAIGRDASEAYKQVTGLIGDHSIVADVGAIGGGLTATFKEGALAGAGAIGSWSQQSSVFGPNPGSNHLNVLVTQGNLPGGVQVWCCNGRGVYQGVEPDFVTMWHELMGETLKYRAGHQNLQRNPDLDSRTVIKIENEIRAVHEMNPRTGTDHGQPVITVNGKVQ